MVRYQPADLLVKLDGPIQLDDAPVWGVVVANMHEENRPVLAVYFPDEMDALSAQATLSSLFALAGTLEVAGPEAL